MDCEIRSIDVSAYKVPTDGPESDGTYEWDSTTLVVVEAHAADVVGLGYGYADMATARMIDDLLSNIAVRNDAMNIPRIWDAMVRSIRNLGRPGVCSMAISVVDAALWDLKARLLSLPLVRLLGAVRDEVPVYGSGGFTSYSISRLQEQFCGWVETGITRAKMKVGRKPDEDVARVRAAREALGPNAELFVDANGAYSRKQALDKAQQFSEYNVNWFEEPVSSDDLEGLRMMRDRAPAGMEIAAGEYGYDLPYFRRMLAAEAVDVLQADATRCAGITEFLRVNALCESFCMPLSAHTAPTLHAHVCCAASRVRHVEYFYDHSRIEQMLFDGALAAVDGVLRPDVSRPGLGIEFKRADAQQYLIYGQATRST